MHEQVKTLIVQGSQNKKSKFMTTKKVNEEDDLSVSEKSESKLYSTDEEKKMKDGALMSESSYSVH